MSAAEGLRAETKKWWREVTREYELEASHLKLLVLECRAWDRAAEARTALAKHWLTFREQHGILRPRPEVVIERTSAILFSRLLRELRFDAAAPTLDLERVPRNSSVAARRQ